MEFTIIKKYLTAEQVMNIAKRTMEVEGFMSREVIKWLLILATATDIEFPKDSEGAVILRLADYDRFSSNGVIEKAMEEIVNWDMIEKQISSLEDLNVALYHLTNKMNEKIDKFKMKDLDIKEFGNILNQVKGMINERSK